MRNLLPMLAAGVLLGDLLAGSVPIVGIAVAYIIGAIAWKAIRAAFPRTDEERTP